MLALLLCLPLAAQDIPRNDGWVTDLGDMLTTTQENELEALMESYKQGSDHEIALLTLAQLGDNSLEDYANEIATAWDIGEKDKYNGALLLVSRDDRKIRWEVGYGLEETLPDIICGRIIRDVMTPQFKAGNFYEGMREAITTAHAAIGGDYAPLEQHEQRRGGSGAGAVIGLVQLGFLILFVVIAIRSRGGRGGGLFNTLLFASLLSGSHRSSGWGGGSSSGGFGGGGFGGFGGGGGGFGGGGASGGW